MEIPFAKTVTLSTNVGFQVSPPDQRMFLGHVQGWIESVMTRMENAGDATQIILQLADQGTTIINALTPDDFDVVPPITVALTGSDTDQDDLTEFAVKKPFNGGLLIGGIVSGGTGGNTITVVVRGSYYT